MYKGSNTDSKSNSISNSKSNTKNKNNNNLDDEDAAWSIANGSIIGLKTLRAMAAKSRPAQILFLTFG